MPYQSVTLIEDISVNKIYSIHYFEYMSDFQFAGESHNFWEMLVVDKGEVDVTAGDKNLVLNRGEVIFHKPNEFHSLKANGKIAPNLVVISFECESPAMAFFEERKLKITDYERSLLGTIIKEARMSFKGRLDDPYQEKLIPEDRIPVASMQIIKLSIELLLIILLRRYGASTPVEKEVTKTPSKLTTVNADTEVYNRILTYMEEHIYANLTIDDLCRSTLVGRSKAQKLFRDRNSCGVINYFSQLKIEKAKELIRNKDMNFTQISDLLGYTSIHYFSRQFKKITGMTPSEYASSIKGISEKYPPV